MPGPRHDGRVRRPAALRALLAGSAVVSVLAAGCADFSHQQTAESWQPKPQLTPQAGPRPQIPGESGPGPGGGGGQGGAPQTPTSIPPPEGCVDHNPAVIGTCLESMYAVASLPGEGTALAAERTTGRIVLAKQGLPATQFAAFQVDAAGDGGLTGLALSPNYNEDQLVFAYITTSTDNRVVRIAPGDTPKPVVTGIPRGATGNRGGITTDRKGALLVVTGDAGNTAAAADPASLAGKVLRINSTGQPADGNPTPGSAVIASGLHSPGGVCTSLNGSQTWVTDRTADKDLLYRVTFGQSLGTPAWTWPDRPGVAGCASWSGSVTVATSANPGVQSLTVNPDGTFNGKPRVTLEGQNGVGRLGGIDLQNEQGAYATTVNKDGGQPVSSDDRVFYLPNPQGGGASGGKD